MVPEAEFDAWLPDESNCRETERERADELG
jgi:hypothetical protein